MHLSLSSVLLCLLPLCSATKLTPSNPTWVPGYNTYTLSDYGYTDVPHVVPCPENGGNCIIFPQKKGANTVFYNTIDKNFNRVNTTSTDISVPNPNVPPNLNVVVVNNILWRFDYYLLEKSPKQFTYKFNIYTATSATAEWVLQDDSLDINFNYLFPFVFENKYIVLLATGVGEFEGPGPELCLWSDASQAKKLSWNNCTLGMPPHLNGNMVGSNFFPVNGESDDVGVVPLKTPTTNQTYGELYQLSFNPTTGPEWNIIGYQDNGASYTTNSGLYQIIPGFGILTATYAQEPGNVTINIVKEGSKYPVHYRTFYGQKEKYSLNSLLCYQKTCLLNLNAEILVTLNVTDPQSWKTAPLPPDNYLMQFIKGLNKPDEVLFALTSQPTSYSVAGPAGNTFLTIGDGNKWNVAPGLNRQPEYFVPQADDTIVADTGDGVYMQTADCGSTWSTVTAEVSSSNWSPLKPLNAQPTVYMGATGSAGFAYTYDFKTFQQCSYPKQPYPIYDTNVAQAKWDGETLYMVISTYGATPPKPPTFNYFIVETKWQPSQGCPAPSDYTTTYGPISHNGMCPPELIAVTPSTVIILTYSDPGCTVGYKYRTVQNGAVTYEPLTWEVPSNPKWVQTFSDVFVIGMNGTNAALWQVFGGESSPKQLATIQSSDFLFWLTATNQLAVPGNSNKTTGDWTIDVLSTTGVVMDTLTYTAKNVDTPNGGQPSLIARGTTSNGKTCTVVKIREHVLSALE